MLLLPGMKERTCKCLVAELESCESLGRKLYDDPDPEILTEVELKDALKRAGERVTEKLNEIRAAAQVPYELLDIQKYWIHKQTERGEEGSCVRGAGFEFMYKGKHYTMPPAGPFQGSMSWEASKDEIEEKLQSLGATDIYYKWGDMD